MRKDCGFSLVLYEKGISSEGLFRPDRPVSMGLSQLLVEVGGLIEGSTIPWADDPVWGAPFHGQMHTGCQARVLALQALYQSQL